MVRKLFLLVALLAIAYGAPIEPEDSDMAKNHLPNIMRPVSARQLSANVGIEGKGHRERGYQSLQTNRGNTVRYLTVANVIPPRTTVVRDTGENVMGDGLSWVVEFVTPELISGTYDAGLRVDIIYGEGGARERITLNASPGFSIAIPATSIDVEVYSVSNPPIGAPSEVRITSLLYRGVPPTAGTGQLSIIVPAGTVFTDIPNFARTMGVMGNGDVASGLSPIFAATATLDIVNGGIGTVVRWDNVALLAMHNAGQRINIPGGARQVLTATPGGIPFLLDFDIEL
jgi:hypothetical protein